MIACFEFSIHPLVHSFMVNGVDVQNFEKKNFFLVTWYLDSHETLKCYALFPPYLSQTTWWKKIYDFIQLKIDMRIFLDWDEIQTLNHEKKFSSSRKKIVAF